MLRRLQRARPKPCHASLPGLGSTLQPSPAPAPRPLPLRAMVAPPKHQPLVCQVPGCGVQLEVTQHKGYYRVSISLAAGRRSEAAPRPLPKRRVPWGGGARSVALPCRYGRLPYARGLPHNRDPPPPFPQRHKICPDHAQATKMVQAGRLVRWCQLCGKFEALSDFDSER